MIAYSALTLIRCITTTLNDALDVSPTPKLLTREVFTSSTFKTSLPLSDRRELNVMNAHVVFEYHAPARKKRDFVHGEIG